MRIEKRDTSKEVMVKTLESGKVFLFEDCYYITTDIDVELGYVVTVDLEDGTEEIFNELKMVLPIDGAFVID
jgi:hypothetical protein